jgi:hypothetical protein
VLLELDDQLLVELTIEVRRKALQESPALVDVVHGLAHSSMHL